MSNNPRKYSAKKKVQQLRVVSKKDPGNPAPVRIEESKEEYLVHLAFPGMQRKDFSITLQGRELTVTAEKKEEVDTLTPAKQAEHPYWSRSFTIPDDADTVMIAALYRNGHLEIHIPKGKKNMSNSLVEIVVY